MAETKFSTNIVKLSKHQNKLCVLFYLAGVIWYLLLSHEHINNATYVDENALLPGLVAANFGRKGSNDAENINAHLSRLPQSKQIKEIENMLLSRDIQTHVQNFEFKSPIPYHYEQKLHYEAFNDTNLYGIVRAGRTASTECILLNLPFGEEKYNYGIGVGIALAWQIRDQSYWAKDIILLFSSHRTIGAQAWMESYHSTQHSEYLKHGPLPERAGNIQAAFVLDVKLPKVSHLNIELVGNDGQLPNCDLLNLVAKIFQVTGNPVALNEQPNPFYYYTPTEKYLHSLHSTYEMMKRQVQGISERNHAVFLQHDIESLSIVGHAKGGQITYQQVGAIIEGTFRSINNLLENLHHSFYFYILTCTSRYISIAMYMPPLGLIVLGPTLKSLILWFDIESSEKKKSNNSDNDESDCDAIDNILEEVGSKLPKRNKEKALPWIELLTIVSIAYISGVALFLCTMFASAWSLMFELSVSKSALLIFVTCYVVGVFHLSWHILHSNFCDYTLKLCRLVAMVILAITISTVSLMNFSLGFTIAVFMVPLNVFNERTMKKSKWVLAFLNMLSSPLLVAVLCHALDHALSVGSSYNIVNDFETILYNLNLYSTISGNWIYAFLCIFVYPSWLLLFVTSVSNLKNYDL